MSKEKVFTRYQVFVIAILSILQFTVILDFMVISPLGVILMKTLSITPSDFSVVVSAYAFSAGASGLLAAGFADKFDRKKLLLFFYTGFILGTGMCAIAPDFNSLLLARIVTGIFGGVIGSVGLAIVTDLFKMEVRGRVMGYTQMAFAASQVLGIPIGLLLANNYGWHSCFWMIAGFGAVVGVIMLIYLKPIDEHLKFRIDKNPFHHLFTTVSKPQYVFGFLTMSLLASGGFMLMPFGSAFGTHNLGLTLDQLPMLYLITGVFSILFGPLSGKLSDKIGKYRTFLAGTLIATIVVVIYTNLGITPFWIACLVSVLLFAGVTARMVSASALLTAIPAPEDRGAFMSVNSAIMQISGGAASVVAGRIVSESKTGMIEHYNDLGYVVVGTMIVMSGMLYFINRSISQRKPATFTQVPEAETGESDMPEFAGEMV
ncbi:MAG: MFS transporter [Bacteroidota bacterium]|nr:MFS transporter [Bacteroidota bacterium]MDP4229867.1 MFS transporter [Bacteroidota bacterium]MDP4235996.1 MFS transporter [Bacteroidota bacterium]